MVGFSAKDPNEKDEVLNIMKAIEKHSYGSNAESSRQLLETIIEKQHMAVKQPAQQTL
jgi:hypothetical protein